jgi:adenylate kinase
MTSGFVLDGFPRTVAQAVALDARLEALGTDVARVVSLEAPDDVVVARLSGRRTCLNCGAVFHIETMPPKQEGVCDDCGSKLVTRTDDKEETIRQRLAVFHTQTQPVLDYYAETGKLFRVDGRGAIEDVYRAAIGGLLV